MMAGVQPFLSGAISKTVNVPEETTGPEILDLYVQAWKMGLKSISIYRDNCKKAQPLNSGTSKSKEEKAAVRPEREHLPGERQSLTHRFDIGGFEGFVTVGKYDDGRPGEIFLKMAKQGSAISGLMDTIAIVSSIALQYGVPLEALVDKLSYMRFEPAGHTKNPDIRLAKSVVDYVFRWLGIKFLEDLDSSESFIPEVSGDGHEEEVHNQEREEQETSIRQAETKDHAFRMTEDAPLCPGCGFMMVRNGTCHKCLNCGAGDGCSG